MANFTSKNWKKNWVGPWSILSSYYLGYQYTKQLKDVLGASFKEVLFISHNGLTACYLVDEDKKLFGTYLAKQAVKNPAIILQWAKNLKSETDKVYAVTKSLKSQTVTWKNFEIFLQAMYDYGAAHRVVKVVVDYLPPDLLKKYLNKLEAARVYAEPAYEETEKYMQYLAKKIANQIKTKSELILALTPTQFKKYFQSGQLPSVTIMRKQYLNTALYMLHGKARFFSGQMAVAKIEKALFAEKETQKISGQIVSSGKVTGRVRIILDPTRVTTFNTGDILVTGMTRPEYLSLVKKSAGFITDAGGILSHAAITARELNKPCVVGTEVATKILKDGDIIELNADQGLIRKLN